MLRPCHGCHRHIRTERSCPFCGASQPSITLAPALIVAGGIILNAAVTVAAPGDHVPSDRGCDEDERSCILRTLKEAYADNPTPPLLLELARGYETAERKGAALTSYLEYQRTCKEAGCVDVTERVNELRPKVGQLHLELVGMVSQIELDGEVVALGDLGTPFFVDPGEHVLEVRWFNGHVDSRRATVLAGETVSLRLLAGPEPLPVPVYGTPPPPGAGRGCGCGEPGARSASFSGNDDQGRPRAGFAILAGAAAAALASRRRRPRSR